MGGYNDDDFKGDMFKHPLEQSQNTWWTLNLSGLIYDGSSIWDSGIDLAIIDSGTSFIYLAQSDYIVFVNKLNNIDGLVCDP